MVVVKPEMFVVHINVKLAHNYSKKSTVEYLPCVLFMSCRLKVFA